jgi:hypothetical protein
MAGKIELRAPGFNRKRTFAVNGMSIADFEGGVKPLAALQRRVFNRVTLCDRGMINCNSFGSRSER